MARELSEQRPGRHRTAACCSYRDIYLDLDPTYKDRFGRPLMRMTFDFHDNEFKMSRLPDRPAGRNRAEDGAAQIVKQPRTGHYYDRAIPDHAQHCGGAIMGTDPDDQRAQPLSAELGRAEPVRDGRDAFPQNAGYNPTGTVGALPYWAADASATQYLRRTRARSCRSDAEHRR